MDYMCQRFKTDIDDKDLLKPLQVMTELTGKETGAKICDDSYNLLLGETCIGNDCDINLKKAVCPPGTQAVGTFHVHPLDETAIMESLEDIVAMMQHGHPISCVSNRHGQSECVKNHYTPLTKTLNKTLPLEQRKEAALVECDDADRDLIFKIRDTLELNKLLTATLDSIPGVERNQVNSTVLMLSSMIKHFVLRNEEVINDLYQNGHISNCRPERPVRPECGWKCEITELGLHIEMGPGIPRSEI